MQRNRDIYFPLERNEIRRRHFAPRIAVVDARTGLMQRTAPPAVTLTPLVRSTGGEKNSRPLCEFSVTRFGDFLDFGHFFKAFGSN